MSLALLALLSQDASELTHSGRSDLIAGTDTVIHLHRAQVLGVLQQTHAHVVDHKLRTKAVGGEVDERVGLANASLCQPGEPWEPPRAMPKA